MEETSRDRAHPQSCGRRKRQRRSPSGVRQRARFGITQIECPGDARHLPIRWYWSFVSPDSTLALTFSHAAWLRQRSFSLSDHCPIKVFQGSETVFRRRLCRSMSLSYGFNHHCHGTAKGNEKERGDERNKAVSENLTIKHADFQNAGA